MRAVGHAVARRDAGGDQRAEDLRPAAVGAGRPDDRRRQRHGKFLDLDVGGLHWSCTWPGPAGCGGRRSSRRPPRPGKGPLALRVVLDDGSGFDLTEAGTQKRLAVYVVADPDEVPGIARLGIDPFDPAFTPERFASSCRTRRRSRGC